MPDAAIDAAVEPDAPSSSHTFVVRDVHFPVTRDEGRTFAFDIDREETPAGDPPTMDNDLGDFLGVLSDSTTVLRWQTESDAALARGDALYLLDLRGDLAGPFVALHSFDGVSAEPSPCASASDAVCGRHLDGAGMFTVGTRAAPAPLGGGIEPDRFDGNATGGTLLLPIPHVGRWVTLHRARAELQGDFAVGMSGRIGGAVPIDEARALVTAIYAPLSIPPFERDCIEGSTQPGCQCAAASDGERMSGLFYGFTCTASEEALRARLDSLIKPDVDLDGDGVDDAITVALRIDAVRGTFTAP